MLICFEGIDHSFKETNSNRLYEELEKVFTCSKFSFPDYNSDVGQHISKLLNSDEDNIGLKLFKLFYDDKVLKLPLLNKLNDSELIIIDRYKHSNLAYGYEFKNELIYKLEERLPEPDVVIYMDIDPEILPEMLKNRAESQGIKVDKFERDLDKLKSAHDNYEKVLKKCKANVIRIKCNEGNIIRTEEDIYKDVLHGVIGQMLIGGEVVDI